MNKQFPDIRSDKGYQIEAADYAHRAMNTLGQTASVRLFETIEKELSKAYLYGAQSAIRIGYRLADQDYHEVIRDYEKQIAELKK